jgi:hypothetical protein
MTGKADGPEKTVEAWRKRKESAYRRGLRRHLEDAKANAAKKRPSKVQKKLAQKQRQTRNPLK